MLLGRTTECGRIDGLLERARSGESGVLVLRGDPGIGKSALLAYAHERAHDLTVVGTRGVESEGELPFSALSELLAPLLDRLKDLPSPQAAALESALALGPPAPGDAFAVAAGALNLIVRAAEDVPVLVLVDDAQWLDAGSAATLHLVARRLGEHAVAMLVAVRERAASVFGGAEFAELHLRGLERDDAAGLLEATARGVTPAVALRLIEATGGSPLALLELPALLDDDQRGGLAPLPDPLPVGTSLQKAFELRLAAMPPETRRALIVAASSSSEALTPVLGALAALELAPESLEPAERAELIAIDETRLTWRHPLLRSTTYYGASSFERRAAHAALASVSSGYERAWHLAATAVGSDEQIASELEMAAMNARLRRGHLAAALAFERSAALSEDDDEAARRSLEASRDFHLSGRVGRARELAEAALASARQPIRRAELQHQIGVIQMWSGDAAIAHELLLTAAGEIELLAPNLAAAILANAALACQMSGNVNRTLAIARRAHEMTPVHTEPLLLNAMILAGESRAARPAVLRLLADRLAAGPAPADAVLFAANVGQAAIWLGEYADARRLFVRELVAARTSGSLAPLPFLLACLSDVEFRLGRWQAALAHASESVQVAEETGQLNVLSFGLVSLARVEAGIGREEPCREHATRSLKLGVELGAGSIRTFVLGALGLLELGLGRPSEALSSLEPLAGLVVSQGMREPGVVEWAADLIESQILCGRLEEARGSLAVLERQALETGNAWAGAVSARARGMMVEDGWEDEFETALRGQPSRFERARTELRLGERLRRERRPTEARTPLRAAHEAFELLGAEGWAAQAAAERAAAGERPRRGPVTDPALLGSLSEQELRVAQLVAEGVTNREAAAALYLSPKTIGYHLSKVYEKLGVRSRTELAHLLSRT